MSPTTSANEHRQQLRAYGTPLVEYHGHGTVRWKNGTSKDLAFEAGQFSSGKIIVAGRYHDSDPTFLFGGGSTELEVEEFSGVTIEGWKLRSIDRLTSTNYLPRTREEGSYDAFRLNQLECERLPDAAAIDEYRFGLVNFRCEGNRATVVQRPGGTHYLRGLAVSLKVGGANVDCAIVSVEDSDDLHRRVITDKSCAVLAELIVPATATQNPEELRNAVGDLCTVLSVMRGTKVQWIYCHEWASGVVSTIHRAGITKAYSPLAPIDSGHESALAAAEFIERGLTVLASSPILGQDRAVVDAYLDAKVEHDFLETRASKVALAIEKLKQAFLQCGMSQVEEFITDDAEFKKIVPSVMEATVRAMEAGGIPTQKARLIAAHGKICGLNRTGFRGVLKGLCRASGLSVPSSEIELFLKCRDYLVHTGRFYCQAGTPEERDEVPPSASPLEEFCFLISFLDRLYLKLFGYTGAYFDWRDFPQEDKRRHLP
jgi:hypothetical protein